MKKTLLLTIDFPPMVGGVSNYWANLLRHLPEDKVVVLAPEIVQSLDFDLDQSYLVLRKLLIKRSKLIWPRWLPMLWQTIKVVRREKIEQIIVGQVLPGGTVAMIVKWLLKVPYILSFHGMDINMAKRIFRKRKLFGKIIGQASQIIVNSEFTKSLIKNDVKEETPITTIYPCSNLIYREYQKEDISKIKNEFDLKDKKIMLSVGRLVARKGFDKVLEALPDLVKKDCNIRYIIIGRGDYKQKLEEKINQLALDYYVQILDNVSDDDLPKFYQLANLFIMPARQLSNGDVEGFGIVYLEAGVYKLPVIAGRSGGAVEAVEDNVNGLVVDPQDEKDIANAVMKILDDDNLAVELGNQGFERIKNKYSWNIQAEKLTKIL